MILRVSPIWDGPRFADRTGWRFVCADCGWRSPVMRWFLGARKHESEHTCARTAA